MEIYLIRHTTPDIAAGVCYGQSDLDIIESFSEEAGAIAKLIPNNIQAVISSPLQRCRKLADVLFSTHTIENNDNLKEIHCGDWELNRWDDIPKEALDAWMHEFVRVPFPNGESYEQLYQRAVKEFDKITLDFKGRLAIVSHGGVIRSILSYISNTPLRDSFDRFKIPYGTVIQLIGEKGSWQEKILAAGTSQL